MKQPYTYAIVQCSHPRARRERRNVAVAFVVAGRIYFRIAPRLEALFQGADDESLGEIRGALAEFRHCLVSKDDAVGFLMLEAQRSRDSLLRVLTPSVGVLYASSALEMHQAILRKPTAIFLAHIAPEGRDDEFEFVRGSFA
jgi:hypothetical protein